MLADFWLVDIDKRELMGLWKVYMEDLRWASIDAVTCL
jgi:hypothetical protein